jgi:hypothetical protein
VKNNQTTVTGLLGQDFSKLEERILAASTPEALQKVAIDGRTPAEFAAYALGLKPLPKLY